ncbi:MAG: hypothetical protein K2G51_00415 [Lachnospiraceae bacterium]|nr:hypothetical protein [Lachnospiraceae bacterium]
MHRFITVKEKLRTGLALLPLILSLTACQSPVSRQDIQSENSSDSATQSQQEIPFESTVETAETTEENSEGALSDEPILIYTGIQAAVTEYNAEYPHYAALKDYLEEKQFTLMRIAHKETTELFEGCEALEWSAEDWDLVRPLNHISSYSCGYGKTDYNNDGKAEIIYRAVDDDKQITAACYQTDDASEQIVAEYNLVHIFQNAVPQDSTLQQLWFEQIGEDIVTFRLLRKNNSEEFVIHSDLVTTNDGEPTCSHLETRILTVTTDLADTREQADGQDIFHGRILNLSAGEGEAFQALRREQLTACQEERPIDSAPGTTILPEGLLHLLEDVLAGTQRYADTWNMEALSAYEDQMHQLTPEQVRTYLGEAFPDHYDWGIISCAYLADLDQNGREELALFYDSSGTAGFADMDVWQTHEDGTAEQLYSFPMLRGYAKLLDYDGAFYFVARQYNFYTGETEGFDILTTDQDNTLQLYSLSLENRENRKLWIETYRNKEIDTRLEQTLTDYLETRKRELEEKTVSNDDYELIDGNAEKLYQEAGITLPLDAFSLDSFDEQSCRIVDFDNDGNVECVHKKIWFPSSLNATLGLIVNFYKEYDSFLHATMVRFPCFINSNSAYTYTYPFNSGTAVDADEMFDTMPVQLWFEEFDQKVYTFYLKRVVGSSDYLLEVSLIEGEQLHPLLQYLLIAEKEFTFSQCPQ